MDVITYAKKNKIPLKNIPPSKIRTGIIQSFLLRKSRERSSVRAETQGMTSLPYRSIGTFSDADCPRIKYHSPYGGKDFMLYTNSGSNLLDRILLLNPKQIGVINEFMEQVFDYGNQIHYLTAKYNIVQIFKNDDIQDFVSSPLETSLDNSKLTLPDALFYKKNTKMYSYGDLNINNMIFSSVLSSFAIGGFERDYLFISPAPNNYYGNGMRSFYSLPFTKKLFDQTDAIPKTLTEETLFGSAPTATNIPTASNESDAAEIEDGILITIQEPTSGSLQSPFFISLDGTMFNERMQIDVTHPLWKSNTLKIEKDVHYNSVGSDISYTANNDTLTSMDTLLTKIYSWKSCLVIFEKIDRNETNLFNSSYEYVLLVGIKTKKYKIIEKIDKLFYIHIGDNYINNDKFSKKDIFLLSSSMRTMLKTYNADKVHFFDLSAHALGNICPNGLLFGVDTEISNRIVNFINKDDNLFIKMPSKIENIYELFEPL